jgi:hypothetical protein
MGRGEIGQSERTYCSPEYFGQNFRLLHLGTIHLTSNHRTKRDFGAQFLRDGECKRGFPGSWSTSEQQSSSRELS